MSLQDPRNLPAVATCEITDSETGDPDRPITLRIAGPDDFVVVRLTRGALAAVVQAAGGYVVFRDEERPFTIVGTP